MSEKSLIGIVRIPKCGSVSLTQMVRQAFDGRRFFDLPTALVSDMGDSPMQRLRARRSQMRHLLSTYRTGSLAKAIDLIERDGSDGDIVGGGHIDHATFARFESPVRYVVLFREPVERFVSEYNYSRAGYFRKKPWLRFDASIKAKLAAKYSLEGYAQALAERSEMFANIAAQYMGIASTADIAPRFDEHVFQAGVLEDLDSFRTGLTAKTGNRFAAVHSNRTANITEADVGRGTRAVLERLFALDYEIYAYAERYAREQAKGC